MQLDCSISQFQTNSEGGNITSHALLKSVKWLCLIFWHKWRTVENKHDLLKSDLFFIQKQNKEKRFYVIYLQCDFEEEVVIENDKNEGYNYQFFGIIGEWYRAWGWQ